MYIVPFITDYSYPPIPDDSACTIPVHNILVIAASTAEPPFSNIFPPIDEHTEESAATAP